MPRWQFELTDNAFNPIGEILNASDRKVAIPLNGMPSMSLAMRMDNPLADYLGQSAGYVKGYRDDVLRFFGPVISAEESLDSEHQTIAVNAVGVGWMLQKRLAGKSATGTVFAGPIDRAQLIKQLIDTANAEAVVGVWDGETGISTGSITGAASPYVPQGSGGVVFKSFWGGGGGETTAGRPQSGAGTANISAASTISNYTAGPYKPIMECLRDMSVGVEGFDWEIIPFDNFTAGVVASQKIGEFRAYPIIGTQRQEAIFEYGTGRNNIMAYKRMVTRDGQANRVYHNAPAGPDAPGYPTVSAINAQSVRDWRLLEDLANADLLEPALRQNLVNEHVRIRSLPRQVLEFQPHLVDPYGRVPNYGVDYREGDNVQARIVYDGRVKMQAWMRVYGVSFDIDNLGMERTTLTLTDES